MKEYILTTAEFSTRENKIVSLLARLDTLYQI